MCGIIGYTGNNEAAPILINGLFKLEYRGYDSSGIAITENNKITVKTIIKTVAAANKIIVFFFIFFNSSFISNISNHLNNINISSAK